MNKKIIANKMAGSKTELDIHIEGLILMIIFTLAWTLSSVKLFDNSDYHIVGIVFGIAILYLIYKYVKLKINKKNISAPPLKNGKKKGRWYLIVVTLEVLAIFLALIILINKKQEHFIMPSIALIVGLHFLPMGRIFNRKFDYYIGFWTIMIAIIGLFLIYNTLFDYHIINAFVCMGCAISTTAYGLKMVHDSNLIIEKYKSTSSSKEPR